MQLEIIPSMKNISTNRSPKGEDIDLGLAILATRRKKGMALPLSVMAAYCGVSPQRIDQLTAKALHNVRAKLSAMPELRAEVEAILDSSRVNGKKTGVSKS